MDVDGQTPMDLSTPRITPDMLGQWEGKQVRLCGRVRVPALRLSSTGCMSAVPSPTF